MINQEDNHRIRNVYLVLYQPEKMFGVVDKILLLLLLGPSNTLHILPIGKVSQPRSRCNTMDGYGRRATDPRPNVVIRTLRRQHRCFTTESVLWPNNPIIWGWAVLFTPWKYIFICLWLLKRPCCSKNTSHLLGDSIPFLKIPSFYAETYITLWRALMW